MVKNFLISGGNGFLGSYLTEKALKEGFELHKKIMCKCDIKNNRMLN